MLAYNRLPWLALDACALDSLHHQRPFTIAVHVHGVDEQVSNAIVADSSCTDSPAVRTFEAPRNKVVVAVANKLARIAWAVLSTGNEYRDATITAA